MKIPKLSHWSMELISYNLIFVHVKGGNNILADAISRLKTLEIYKDPLENPKTITINDTEVEEVVAKIQTLSKGRLCAKQKKDINCRNSAAQSHHKKQK